MCARLTLLAVHRRGTLDKKRKVAEQGKDWLTDGIGNALLGYGPPPATPPHKNRFLYHTFSHRYARLGYGYFNALSSPHASLALRDE